MQEARKGKGRDTEYEAQIIVAVFVGVKEILNIICKYFLLK